MPKVYTTESIIERFKLKNHHDFDYSKVDYCLFFSKLFDIYLYIRQINTYRNMKRRIRTKETELKRIISESVREC